MDQFEYRKQHTLMERTDEIQRIRSKYPDRIPVYFEIPRQSDRKIISLDKNKFLLTQDMTMSQIQFIIRKRIKNLSPDQALFLLVNGHALIRGEELMVHVYRQYMDQDGFLYIAIALESTFVAKKDVHLRN